MPKSELTGSARLIQSEFGLLWRLLARFNRGPAVVTTLVFETKGRPLTLQWHRGRDLYRWRREEVESSNEKILANLEEELWLSHNQARNRLSSVDLAIIKQQIARHDPSIYRARIISEPSFEV